MAYLYRVPLAVIEDTPWEDVALMIEAANAIENPPPEKPKRKRGR